MVILLLKFPNFFLVSSGWESLSEGTILATVANARYLPSTIREGTPPQNQQVPRLEDDPFLLKWSLFRGHSLVFQGMIDIFIYVQQFSTLNTRAKNHDTLKFSWLYITLWIQVAAWNALRVQFGNKSILGGTWIHRVNLSDIYIYCLAILRLWPFWDGENLTRTHSEVVNVTSNVLGGIKSRWLPRRRGNAQRSSDAATCLGGMKHRSRRMSNCFTPIAGVFLGFV